MKFMASHPIYQFYVELKDYEPKIWRRFQVMNNITMARFGYIIMTMFEMKANHLYQFEINERDQAKLYFKDKSWIDTEEKLEKFFDEFNYAIAIYGIPNEIDDNPHSKRKGYKKPQDASEKKMKDVINIPSVEMDFWYDFGDNWHVKVVLEKIIEETDLIGRDYPRVLEGEGYGIVEDVSGTGGLERLVNLYNTKKGEEYEELSAWFGHKDFDFNSFDIADMNFRLKKVPRIYADIYEYGLEPTRRSLKLLERDYLNNSKIEDSIETQIEDFTLLLIYLTAFEDNWDRHSSRLTSWSGYDHDILRKFEENNLFWRSGNNKKLNLTIKGREEINKVLKKYDFIQRNETVDNYEFDLEGEY